MHKNLIIDKSRQNPKKCTCNSQEGEKNGNRGMRNRGNKQKTTKMQT